MTERAKSDRTLWLEALCWLAFLAALTPNTIAAFAGPTAAWWDPLRAGLSAAFVASLAAVCASRIRDRRGGS